MLLENNMYANECASAATTLLADMFSVWEVKEVWWEKRMFLYLFCFALGFVVFFGQLALFSNFAGPLIIIYW